MTTWTKAPTDLLCGACKLPIAKSQPVLEVSWPGLARPKLRCPACAGQDVPVTFPETQPLTKSQIPDLFSIGSMAREFKLR